MRTFLRRHVGSAFTVFMILFLAGVVWSASDFTHQARFFPWAIGIPALILTVFQLVIETVRVRRRETTGEEEDEGIVDLAVDRSVPLRTVALRAGELAGWIVGYFVAILVFGFIVASPVFVLLYLVLRSQARWTVILLCLVLVMLLQIGVFDRVLHVPWLKPVVPGPQRWVLDFLGR